MSAPRYAREIPRRYRMEAARCVACDAVAFPPRAVCDKCRGRRFEIVRLPREGRIVSFTVIHATTDALTRQAPYVVAIVELAREQEICVTAQIVDARPEEIAVGQRVRQVLRRVQTEGAEGIIHYGYKFVLDRS